MLNSLTSRQKGLICVFSTALCWSFLALFLKFALKFTDSYTIVWYRMVVPFFILFFWYLFRNEGHKLKVLLIPPGALFMAALALSYNYLGFMEGVHYTSPANAQVFIQMGPLLLAASGIFIFKERLNLVQKVGFLFCTLGFSFFYWDRMQINGNHQGDFYLGMLWIISAAIAWAIFATIQKKLLLVWHSSQINIYIYLVATLLYMPFVNWNDLIHFTFSNHLLLIFLGFNTLIAYGCLSLALKYLPATQVSPIITLNPLFTLIMISLMDWLNWTFIPADPIGLVGYIGAIAAIMGVVLVLANKKPQGTLKRI